MKYLILLYVLGHSYFSYSQPFDCEFLKKGKFLLVDSIHGNTFIKRRRNIQIEYGELSQLKLKLKIKWIGDCSYSLSLAKVLKNPNEINVSENFQLQAEIVELNKEFYRVKSRTNQNEKIFYKRIIIK